MNTLKSLYLQLYPLALTLLLLALLARAVWACDPFYEDCGNFDWWAWLLSLFDAAWNPWGN